MSRWTAPSTRTTDGPRHRRRHRDPSDAGGARFDASGPRCRRGARGAATARGGALGCPPPGAACRGGRTASARGGATARQRGAGPACGEAGGCGGGAGGPWSTRCTRTACTEAGCTRIECTSRAVPGPDPASAAGPTINHRLRVRPDPRRQTCPASCPRAGWVGAQSRVTPLPRDRLQRARPSGSDFANKTPSGMATEPAHPIHRTIRSYRRASSGAPCAGGCAGLGRSGPGNPRTALAGSRACRHRGCRLRRTGRRTIQRAPITSRCCAGLLCGAQVAATCPLGGPTAGPDRQPRRRPRR